MSFCVFQLLASLVGDATTTKLRCPDHLEIAWVNIAPYIFTDENEKVTGVFPTLLKDIFSYCCKDVTNFTFTQKLSGFNKFDFVVKNNSADIIVPIYGNANKKYLLGRPYLSLGMYVVVISHTIAVEFCSYALIYSVDRKWHAFLLLRSQISILKIFRLNVLHHSIFVLEEV